MIDFKVSPRPRIEVFRGGLWRTDWSDESKESLDNYYGELAKDFGDNVYRYINMIGVSGVVLHF